MLRRKIQSGTAPTTIQPPAPLYLTARYEQLSHIHPKVGIGAVAANAFLFTHNADTYVITSAHTLFSEPMAPNATPPTEVTVGRTTLGPMAYSRFFDVAIFQKPQEVTGAAYSSISAGDGSATAHFEDPNADIQFTHVANYTENINRRTQTGVFFYPLMQGSSGSAISRNGKLVGMVSGVDQKYDNLTVCVPAQTIVDLIAKIPADYQFATDLNLDTQLIFPHMLTAPIPKALKAEFPESNLSHLVLYAKDNLVLPLTMIEANVANKALDSGNLSTSFKVKKIKEEYQKWFRFPREVYGYTNNNDNTFDVGTSVVASKNDFLSDQNFDDMCWEGMNVMVSGNLDFLQNQNNSDNNFQQPTQINRKDLATDQKAELFPMSTVYTRFFNANNTVDNFLTSKDYIFNEQNIEKDVDNIQNVTNENAAIIYDKIIIGQTTNTPNYITLQKATLKNNVYKELIELCLVRHWVFLVMSGLKGVPDQGYQFIVFAEECQRLKSTLMHESLTNYDSINNIVLATIMNTLVEFTDIHAMNFLQILIQVFGLSFDDLIILASYFPMETLNLASSNFVDFFETVSTVLSADAVNTKVITVENTAGIVQNMVIAAALQNVKVINVDGNTITLDTNVNLSAGSVITFTNQTLKPTQQFDQYGNSSFNLNGLEAEHYKINPTLAQATTAARTDDRATDTVGMELELVYAEMERLNNFTFSEASTDPNYYYYPQSFEIVKSIWDHSHNTMANLLPELGKAFAAETTVTVTLGDIPAGLRAWPMLESKAGHQQGCYLCTKMKEHGVVSEEEFHTITQAITPYAFATHRKELMVYFEFAPGVLQSLETQDFDWAGLRGFADSMLKKIANNDLESAYTEWMQTILKLKEEAGQPIEDLKLLDVAIAGAV